MHSILMLGKLRHAPRGIFSNGCSEIDKIQGHFRVKILSQLAIHITNVH